MVSILSVNKLYLLHSDSDSFPQTSQPTPLNLGKVSNSTFPKWKICTVDNGIKILVFNLDGDIRETQTDEYKRQN
jgi:hypothetical protein